MGFLIVKVKESSLFLKFDIVVVIIFVFDEVLKYTYTLKYFIR